MADFINSLGFVGVAGLVGCWLIVGAILGELLAVRHIFNRDVQLQHAYQRVLLGVFGGVLLGPGLHTMYNGSSARLIAPDSKEFVAPAGPSQTKLRLGKPDFDQSIAKLRRTEYHPLQAGLVPALVFFQGRTSCSKVESFGVHNNSIRRLKYQAFRGRLYFYVGAINSPRRGSTQVYLFSTDASAPPDGSIDNATFQRLWKAATPLQEQESVQRPGDSFDFPYAGGQYKLTVSQIYKVLLGDDQVAVDVCAL